MVLNAGSIKGGIKLVNARHPLLPQSKAVPITVGVGDDFSVLIITGPNTGGKTVSLKTIGLLVLMTQAGIPIPADESSQIPIFDNIFADIGDEQSIEQTLSTFSWHMSNIVRIIQTSTSNSLVLLDELGISTDPTEGAALARAIMLHFLARQTLTVVTTHYSELKVFAHATEGMQNASLEFDPVTLTPTYHLTLGIPGGSNALAIASKLGLPDEIIDSAKEMLSSTAQEIDELLADLTRETQATRNMRLEIEKERKEIGSIRSSIDNELQELRERERIVIQDVRERLADEAALLHQQIRKASTELKKKKSKENIEKAKKELKSVREHLDSPEWKTEDELKEVPTGEVIAIGDMVKVIDTNLKGLVLSISEKNQVEIQVGKTRFKVDAGELVKTDSQIEPEAPSRRFTIQRDVESKRRSIELDLRGKRADEVEPELDAYLNDTSIAGFNEVRIIHGYGTGTVRQIVRDMLASHPLVRSFRTGGGDEGGDGVTVAHL